ncbi:hypothetical protein M2459_000371 [Parabacteroides sp. PF5-5]|uniref:hypothetical protein n=1 Tax=unclassified Parabacteroides TaxID=2649774 RepID=UPI00247452D2|nr:MULTISPECIES: hypothetical protein [unclassified Parabacteroides]MDH6306384.1 hypothetical protein [Parabacteroides sp. PH5-39]MDH6314656.1 hypothetical protein [Parabacteroides sp. PF5-13]MDH6321095.1 hypothetical protein [Parabacteroides sp. PH5-13]MDH6324827.1 hypothetical protein [Parabacteroides sp. PH5-8]MDH6325492.1 hypothetical protein [Parabacteroides sp. PH5-41]
MKKVTLRIMLGISIFSIGTTSAQTKVSNQEKEAAVHLSFIPPLSTNGIHAGQYTNHFSLNLLAGISKNETAFTLGGLGNIVLNNANGFQLAGLANYVGNNFTGLQVAGLVNIAKNVSGVQLAGLLNIANQSDYPIGLINIIKEGEMGISATYNEIGTTAITFRSGGRVTYGILGLGYNHKAKEKEAFTALGGLGAHVHIASWLRINNELTIESVNCFSDDETTFKAAYALLPACKIGQYLELFAGPNINYMQSDNPDNHKLFPSHSLWKKEQTSKLQQLYIGYQVGIQYIF